MKRAVLAFVVALTTLTATVASAQEESAKLRWSGLTTNRFWDNWEVAAAFGNSFLGVSSDDPGKFKDRNSWNANISFTKWALPTLGMRLQLDGGQFQNYSLDPATYGDGLFHSPYVFVHGDILVNLSNWIGGYRDDRIYYAIPYVGFGVTTMNFTGSTGSKNTEYALSAGMLHKFRVSRQWDIELDTRTWVLREGSLAPEIRGGGKYAVTFSASIGVAYRFNKRHWTPALTEVDVAGYVAAIAELSEDLAVADAEIVEIAAVAAKLNDDNKSLKAQLAECNKVQQQPSTTACAMTEGVVFFNIGEAKLTDYAQATLNGYIATLKDGSANLTVTGYADKETGNAAINERLSEERAEAVKVYMVKHGIAAERITTKWVGDTEEAFTSPATPIVNRCAIIE
ncbi:MAG: OmpA family protein [Alistipes sp.]|nr:OmpA family protein [Alistipes sp.]